MSFIAVSQTLGYGSVYRELQTAKWNITSINESAEIITVLPPEAGSPSCGKPSLRNLDPDATQCEVNINAGLIKELLSFHLVAVKNISVPINQPQGFFPVSPMPNSRHELRRR
jgi:hypothetical protein